MPQVVIPNMLVAAQAGQGLPKPPNMLELGNQALQMRGQMLQNQGLQNQLTGFNAKVAGAQDYLRSLGANGQVDPVLLNRNLQGDPNAALAAPDLMKAAQDNLVTQLQAKGLSLNQAHQRMTYAADSLSGLLNRTGPDGRPVPITDRDIRDILTNGTATGMMEARDAASLLSTLPGNPQGNRQWVVSHLAMVNGGLKVTSPIIQGINTGGSTQLLNTNPGTPGGVGIVGSVPNTLTPGEAATPVQYPGPNGQTLTATRGAIAASGNQLPTGAGGTAPVVAGLTAAEQSGQAGIGTADAQQLAEWQKHQTEIPQQMNSIRQGMAEAAKFPTGPLGGTLAQGFALLNQLGVSNNVATSGALLQKSTAMQVLQTLTGGSLGAGTNDKMAMALTQTPNIEQPGIAYQTLGGIKLGSLAYDQAANKVAMQWGLTNNPVAFAQFRQTWAQTFPDPMVFMAQYVPKQFLKTYFASETKAQREAFGEQYQRAVKMGLIGGANGGQ